MEQKLSKGQKKKLQQERKKAEVQATIDKAKVSTEDATVQGEEAKDEASSLDTATEEMQKGLQDALDATQKEAKELEERVEILELEKIVQEYAEEQD